MVSGSCGAVKFVQGFEDFEAVLSFSRDSSRAGGESVLGTAQNARLFCVIPGHWWSDLCSKGTGLRSTYKPPVYRQCSAFTSRNTVIETAFTPKR